uniref:Putative apolipophorin-iii thitarodes pui n=1 Tax=Xenopsylla cheopis TaxID=163159 RepID=A0A6M2E0E9_XENCH
MSIKFTFVCLAVCALVQVSLGDAPAQNLNIEQATTLAKETLKNIENEFHKVLDVENNDQLVEKIKEKTNELKDTLQTYITEIGGKTNDWGQEFTNLFNQVSNSVSQKIQELESNNPEMKKQAEEVKAKFETTYQTVVDAAGKLTKDIGESTGGMNEKLSNLTKEVLTQAQAIVTDVSANVEKFIKDQEAKPAH